MVIDVDRCCVRRQRYGCRSPNLRVATQLNHFPGEVERDLRPRQSRSGQQFSFCATHGMKDSEILKVLIRSWYCHFECHFNKRLLPSLSRSLSSFLLTLLLRPAASEKAEKQKLPSPPLLPIAAVSCPSFVFHLGPKSRKRLSLSRFLSTPHNLDRPGGKRKKNFPPHSVYPEGSDSLFSSYVLFFPLKRLMLSQKARGKKIQGRVENSFFFLSYFILILSPRAGWLFNHSSTLHSPFLPVRVLFVYHKVRALAW